jgi:hypothetical protein
LETHEDKKKKMSKLFGFSYYYLKEFKKAFEHLKIYVEVCREKEKV